MVTLWLALGTLVRLLAGDENAATGPETLAVDSSATLIAELDGITVFPPSGELARGVDLEGQRFAFVLPEEMRAMDESYESRREDLVLTDFDFKISPGRVRWGAFETELSGPDSLRIRLARAVGDQYVFADYVPKPTRAPARSHPPILDDDRPLPEEWTIWPLALGLGIVCIGGIVVFRLLKADLTFRTVEQIEEKLDLAVVGSVPNVSRAGRRTGALWVAQQPDGPVAESFRSLRVALSRGIGSAVHRTTLFTSAIPGEGKTFCSINYAMSLAQLGERTLMINGDLRRPALDKFFFDEAPEEGVGAVLEGKCPLDSAVCVTSVENLFILPAGRRTPRAAELIATGTFHRLIKEVAGKFDHIVVDSPPVLAVSDALLLLGDVQTICLVIRAGRTAQRKVKRVLHMIKGSAGSVSGVVLNGVHTFGADYFRQRAREYGGRIRASTRRTKPSSTVSY
jgi:capsular exopolysaccharide synthesis family protein